MEKVSYRIIFNRKKQLNEAGRALIQVEARLSKKRKYFSTKIYVKPNQWDSKRKMIKNHPNMKALNQFIQDFVSSMEYKELKAWNERRTFDLDDLGKKNKQVQINSFSEFYKTEVNRVPVKELTRKNHLSTLSLLVSYNKNILFDDLSYGFLCDFERFLLAKRMCRNTIAKHLGHIKRYVNLAIDKNLLDAQKYPFRKYKIKFFDTPRTYLTPEELTLLEQVELSEKNAVSRRCLDAFLFSCYTGLRYSDVIRIRRENIVSINNKVWLNFPSAKTGTEVRIPLFLLFEGKALFILERYGCSTSFIFKIPDNSNVNKQLAKICMQAGISKKVSFHTARHTNATLLLYNGVNITTVKKILGHKHIRTTQIYCNVMDMTIVRDLENSNKNKI